MVGPRNLYVFNKIPRKRGDRASQGLSVRNFLIPVNFAIHPRSGVRKKVKSFGWGVKSR